MGDDELRAEVPVLDEQSRRALTSAEQWIGDGVQGVGIGATPDGAPCVVVYALAPQSDAVRALPERCEGLPVRVETGDSFTAED